MSDLLVEGWRGHLAETLHRGDIAVTDSTGRILLRAGDPAAKVTYWRSSAKPFQAMVAVYTGAMDRFERVSADLAMLCASHNGEDVHTERVMAMLGRLGLGPEHLQCGAHPPSDPQTAHNLQQQGLPPSSLHSNCSGKHTGMLAVSLQVGADPAGYLAPDHPVQRLIHENVGTCAGVPPDQIAVAVDGCGVPTFALPVDRMALAFARLADPDSLVGLAGFETGLPTYDPPTGDRRRAAAAEVWQAMISHPYLVAGRRRLDTDLMQVTRGRLVAKMGADGVYCVGIPAAAAAASPVLAAAHPAGGVGLALKMEDGVGKFREAAVVAALTQLALLSPVEREALAPYHTPVLRNVAGRAVGEIRPVFRLQG